MHEITGLIKNYLRTMEEPLLLFKFYNDFISIGKKVTHINKFNSTKNTSSSSPVNKQKALITRTKKEILLLLKRLPENNYLTLEALCKHLRNVEECKDGNKMTWGNIAIVIGPNILRPERDTMETMLHAKEINVCIEFLFQTISSLIQKKDFLLMI